MKKKIFNSFVELTGHPVTSTLLKTFTRSRLSRPLIRPFSRLYKINEEEMAHHIGHYDSLQAFFTREMKEGTRSFDQSANILASPVDGVLSGSGIVDTSQTIHIKNRPYRISEIFGDVKKAAPYQNGFFYLLYLSPSHYHHFHYPISGDLVSRYALGDISFPVNDLGLRLGNSPFSTNYRLISEVATSFGKVAIVKVGALNVNSIHIRDSSKTCIKGDEFGYFSFGSTVILFLEHHPDFHQTIANNTEVKLGQSIGEWIES